MFTKPNRAALFTALLIICLLTSLTPQISTASSPATPHPAFLSIQEQPPLSGYPIEYTSFAGTVYNLTAYDGLYCRYALPNSWTAPGALTNSQLRRLVDLTDLTYAQLAEITAGEPQGPGLLTIAVIPTGTMAGHAGSNFKGIELSNNELGSVIQNINTDLLSPEIQHELCHNYERFVQMLSLGYPDTSHAWTSFLIPFLQYYSRAGILQSDAPALFQKKITEYTLAWDSSGATWTQCVRNGNTCANIQANSAWAGLLLRYTKLHGVEAIKRTFRYIQDYSVTHPTTGTNPTGPVTQEEKNDLLVEALSIGAQRNILCEIDTWHWFATPQARDRINQQFPLSNSLCLDTDGDGFSPLNGDTDDATPQIKPTAMERLNNIDDDCDLLVDNPTLTEQTDFPSTAQSAPTITIPTKVRGTVIPSDLDTVLINFTGTLPQRLRVNLQSSNSFVGFIQLQPVDLNGRTQSFAVAGGGAQILTLTRPGLWALTIQNSTSSSSDYTLTVENAGPQTIPVRLKVTPGPTAGTIRINATLDSFHVLDPAPNAIRFWIGTTGLLQPSQLPLQPEMSFVVPIPGASGPISLRAQLLSNDTPVTKASPPLWINPATSTMLEQNPDLAIIPDTSLPGETPTGSNASYGFTITNLGPGLAQDIEANVTIPPGLLSISVATTFGTAQLNNNSFHLAVNQLAPDEAVSFYFNATNVSAQGTITATATLISENPDPIPANNTASITGHFSTTPTPTPSPTPTPTPTPTPLPTPSPNDDLPLQSLPLKLTTAPSKSLLAQGSLARVTVMIPNTALLDTYGQPNQNGIWPTRLAGIQIKVGPTFAAIISLTRIPESNPSTYNVDFVIPETATIGTQVPLIISYNEPTNSWTTTATIQPTAPAFWALDGTANGPLLTLDADQLTTLNPSVPIQAGTTQRILLFASGIKRLVDQNTLVLHITCESGYQALLVQDFAATTPSLPGLQQITIRIPSELAGCGRAQLSIQGSQDNQVFLRIQ